MTGNTDRRSEPTDLLRLRMDVAQRGVDWRDAESQRLADRAATLLGVGSISLSIGAGFAQGGGSASGGWLVAALIIYITFAALVLLALRPRPMPRSTGYAVQDDFQDAQELYAIHLTRLLERGETLDHMTLWKARLVTASALLLMLEITLLVSAIMLSR